MNLKIGDIVKYLNDVGGGKVQRIISSTMVEILDDNGFVIPVANSELLCVKTHEASVSTSTEEPIATTHNLEVHTEIEGHDSPQFYIGFTKISSAALAMHIINDCNFYASVHLFWKKDALHEFDNHYIIEPNTKILAKELQYDSIHTITGINLHISLFKTYQFSLLPPIEISKKINPSIFYKQGAFKENDFFDEDAYMLPLENENKSTEISKESLEEMLANKHRPTPPTTTAAKTKQTREQIREVDLHIHEITDDDSILQPFEKLQAQINTFEAELSKAMHDSIEKIVFIHGVGNGTLKARIRHILDSRYPTLQYQDASFKKYKFGATLIFL